MALFTEDEIKAASPEEKRLFDVGEKLHTALSKRATEDQKAGQAETLAALSKEFEERLAKFAEDLSKRNPTWSLPGVEPVSPKTGKGFSLARAACAIASREWANASYEKEVFDNMRKRAMTFGNDQSGGFMVPTELMGGIIEKLNAEVITFTLGVRQIDGAMSAPILRNRKTGNTTAQWVGEMTSAAKSQVTLKRMELSPKQLSAKTDLSNLLLQLSGGAAEQLITDDFAEQFALGTDLAILVGTGTGGQPLGIANQTGVLTSTAATPTYDQMLAFIGAVRGANALRGSIGWAMSNDKLLTLEQMKDASNQPLVRRLLDGATITERFLGYPYGVSTQLPGSGANAVIFGNFASAFLMRWFGGMTLKASDVSDTALDQNMTRVTAIMYADVGVDQPTAFCVASA